MAPPDHDIVDLLEDWFHHGLLRLEEIDDGSPFRIIRFLKQPEMVHPMVALEDMGRRSRASGDGVAPSRLVSLTGRKQFGTPAMSSLANGWCAKKGRREPPSA